MSQSIDHVSGGPHRSSIGQNPFAFNDVIERFLIKLLERSELFTQSSQVKVVLDKVLVNLGCKSEAERSSKEEEQANKR